MFESLTHLRSNVMTYILFRSTVGSVGLLQDTHEVRHLSQQVPVAVPHPVPVTVTKAVPVPQPVPVDVPNPVAVPVPVQVPYDVPRAYPVSVPHPVPVRVNVPTPVVVPRPYNVEVTRPVPVDVPRPVPVRVSRLRMTVLYSERNNCLNKLLGLINLFLEINIFLIAPKFVLKIKSR